MTTVSTHYLQYRLIYFINSFLKSIISEERSNSEMKRTTQPNPQKPDE